MSDTEVVTDIDKTKNISMNSIIYKNLRKLINVVDELRDVGLQKFINLPRICVIGTQSCGKSSVLESIVGTDFLPRGEGIVTRRPTELRLVHLSEMTNSIDDAWAIFDSDKSKKYTDFQLVKKEIERLTDEVAGKNKGIKDDPITLTIYATQCPDLTIVDLPGITRVPLRGSDQTDDIERLTREMAYKYINDSRTIILAVIPANADITTSDSLQLARRVDPSGSRTIGVITKVDLMDRGTNAAKMLLGEDVKLALGYVALKNRSQADIISGKSVSDALKEETAFFTSSSIYSTLPPGLCGTSSLVDKLTKILFQSIKNLLPEIKGEISSRISNVEQRLIEIGASVPSENTDKAQLLWRMISDYCEVFDNTIRGKYDKRLQYYFQDREIPTGAKIRAIFNHFLVDYVDYSISDDIEDSEIILAMTIHEGDALPGFPSPDTFEYLILPHLRKIEPFVAECLDRVSKKLEEMSVMIVNRVFGRFPQLVEQVLELSQRIIFREVQKTKTILDNFIKSETSYLFTNDETYLDQHSTFFTGYDSDDLDGKKNFVSGSQTTRTSAVVHTKPAIERSSIASKKEKDSYRMQFVEEIRHRLDAYFALVIHNVRDSVPKTIGHFLVRRLQSNLQFELYNDLNRRNLADLLGEPMYILEERKSLDNQLKILKKSLNILQRDKNITSINVTELDPDNVIDGKMTTSQAESSSPVHSSIDAHRRKAKANPLFNDDSD